VRVKFKADWGYVIFFIKYNVIHPYYAYIGGPSVVMKFINPAEVTNVAAHESGHIFNALDEYLIGVHVCSEFSNGPTKVKNQNSLKPGPSGICSAEHSLCIMDTNTFDNVCTFTQGQIGWWPSKGIFLFFQGQGRNETLWYSVFDGASWWRNQYVPNVRFSGSPAPVFWENNVIVFYNVKGALTFSTFTGGEWVFSKPVNPNILYSPSAVEYNKLLYVFVCTGNRLLGVSTTSDGNAWNHQEIPRTHIDDSTSAVVLPLPSKPRLLSFYRGADRNLYYTSFDGTTWLETMMPYNMQSDKAPAAVFFDQKIFVFFRSIDGRNALLYTTSSDGGNWAQPKNVSNYVISNAPGAAVAGGNLVLFYQGIPQNGIVFSSSSKDGVNWPAPIQVPGIIISESARPVVLV